MEQAADLGADPGAVGRAVGVRGALDREAADLRDDVAERRERVVGDLEPVAAGLDRRAGALAQRLAQLGALRGEPGAGVIRRRGDPHARADLGGGGADRGLVLGRRGGG